MELGSAPSPCCALYLQSELIVCGSQTQHGLAGFGLCTGNLPRSSCHLCCFSMSQSSVLPATCCKSQITLSLLVMLALARDLHMWSWVCYLSSETFPPTSHPVFTICILEIHVKYFYNPLYCIFNLVNCTKVGFLQ